MEATKALTVVAVVAVGVAVFNLVAILTTSSEFAQTGFANLEYGNATLEVEGTASITFTKDLINWSTGAVDNGFDFALLNTSLAGSVADGSWTSDTGLTLENDGNNNVNLTLESDSDPATFVPSGTNTTAWEGFFWTVIEDEVGSCNSGLNVATYQEVPAGVETQVCGNLSNVVDFSSTNSLRIDLTLSVPRDASPGPKLAVLTARAYVV